MVKFLLLALAFGLAHAQAEVNSFDLCTGLMFFNSLVLWMCVSFSLCMQVHIHDITFLTFTQLQFSSQTSQKSNKENKKNNVLNLQSVGDQNKSSSKMSQVQNVM